MNETLLREARQMERVRWGPPAVQKVSGPRRRDEAEVARRRRRGVVVDVEEVAEAEREQRIEEGVEAYTGIELEEGVVGYRVRMPEADEDGTVPIEALAWRDLKRRRERLQPEAQSKRACMSRAGAAVVVEEDDEGSASGASDDEQ